MSTLFDVRPVAPLTGYIGGKRDLTWTLVPTMDPTPHEFFGDTFAGRGVSSSARAAGRGSRDEAINDASDRL